MANDDELLAMALVVGADVWDDGDAGSERVNTDIPACCFAQLAADDTGEADHRRESLGSRHAGEFTLLSLG